MAKDTSNKHKKDPLEISVVICTYNRKKYLENIIGDIVNQTIDKSHYEIIVVDNNSTDGTKELIASFLKSYKKPRIVFLQEKKLGLGFARNYGLKKAEGKYLAFLDDDSSVDKDYLEKILAVFKKIKPTPLAIGGKVLPHFEKKIPSWFKKSYETVTFSNSPRYLKKGESFSGPNMIFQKKVLENLGGFHTEIGMKGELLSVGEETDVFEKLWQREGKEDLFYYCPDLIVKHFIPLYKTKLSYQLKRFFASGQAWYKRQKVRHFLPKAILFIKIFLGFCLYGFLALIHIVRYKRYQNWMIECWEKPLTFFGALLGTLGVEIRLRQVRNEN